MSRYLCKMKKEINNNLIIRMNFCNDIMGVMRSFLAYVSSFDHLLRLENNTWIKKWLI